MSDNKMKKFNILHVFNEPSSLSQSETAYGDVVEHFGAKWKIGVFKDIYGDIYPSIFCEGSQTGNWSINTVCKLLVGGISVKTGMQFEFNRRDKKFRQDWILKEDFHKYGINESVRIQYGVKIIQMTGIEERPKMIEDNVAKKSSEIEKWQKSMNFDDGVAKESSDIVLKIGDQKFYVAKLLLTFHSTYFKTLFSGNFSESKQSEIELKDIDPDAFQYFLELIYGISLVNDTMIMELFKLADFFDAQIVIERCQEFLLNRSQQSLKIKFQVALKYKMEELKVRKTNNCD
ncbi:hypothetical protein B9Z55_007941 [Caenorhabditis nigoni]|uniref:BTB domain-containing protein n=1 Tax=Caenorhabditis nigoni TaxID=1611254 RepID=A0A2G5VBW7_9PELO|nr:hypothetical protein B9Z55_007941 [Caenorhabditis nigoni]